MTAAPETVEGGCFCGAVRFRVELPSLFCGHCHCSMCRRLHGAGYVTWFAVTEAKLRVEAGEPDLENFQSSDHGSRAFCRRCGSQLFCRSSHHPDRVDIPLASMHGPIDRAPQVHVWFDSGAPWVVAADGLPRLGGATGLEPLKDDSEENES